jgi:hypothetical protein
MKTLDASISSLAFGTPQRYRNLTLVPLIALEPRGADYLTLDEAISTGAAEVTELSESGSVPELRFRNRGDRDVLLLMGEELVGAKQNRVLNVTILVAAGQDVVIPVSCVEAGRWGYRSRAFRAADRTMYAAGRARLMEDVAHSLKASRTRRSDQSRVWQDIDAKMARMQSMSSTAAMADLYEQQATHVDAFRDAFTTVEAQVGAVFFIDDRAVGLEVFDAPSTWLRQGPKLIASYAIDALDGPGNSVPANVGDLEARSLLEQVLSASSEAHASLGKGLEIRLESLAIAGAGLELADRVVHLCVYSKAA